MFSITAHSPAKGLRPDRSLKGQFPFPRCLRRSHCQNISTPELEIITKNSHSRWSLASSHQPRSSLGNRHSHHLIHPSLRHHLPSSNEQVFVQGRHSLQTSSPPSSELEKGSGLRHSDQSSLLFSFPLSLLLSQGSTNTPLCLALPSPLLPLYPPFIQNCLPNVLTHKRWQRYPTLRRRHWSRTRVHNPIPRRRSPWAPPMSSLTCSKEPVSSCASVSYFIDFVKKAITQEPFLDI